MVHVYLEEGRNFLPSSGDTTDPQVTIKVFEKKKISKKFDDVGSASSIFWGEHFFWMRRNCEVAELEAYKILIEVESVSKIGKNDLIGSYLLDFSYVYIQTDHCLKHYWIGLANTNNEDFSQVTGYLKLGIQVTTDGDKQVDLEKLTEEEKAKESGGILLPPVIPAVGHQVIVTLVRGEGFPKLESWGSQIDGLATVEFQARKLETEVVETEGDYRMAAWNEDLYFPCNLPIVNGRLNVKFYDYEKVGSNDFIGQVTFPFDYIKNGKYNNYFWVNIYGAHGAEDNEEAMRMAVNPSIASAWKGRCLLRITSRDEKKPKLMKVPATIEEADIQPMLEEVKWELRAEIYNGTSLPDRDEKFRITIKWGPQTIQTDKQKNRGRRTDWFESLDRMITGFPGIQNIEDLPYIYIYLTQDDDHIEFARVHPKKFQNLDASPDHITLKPDKALGEVEDAWEAGFLRMRAYVGRYGQEEDLKYGRWDKPITKPSPKRWNLVANLYQARGIPPADSDGTSDPFVIIYSGGSQVESTTKNDTCNPIYYETFSLPVEFDNPDDSPPIIVSVMDYDLTGNDMLGRVIIDMEQAAFNDPTLQRPKWYKLDMGKPGTSEGEVLVGFNILQEGQNLMLPPTGIRPKTTPVTMEFNCLGLRALVPTGLMPVRKAYIKFDLNSLYLEDVDEEGKKEEDADKDSKNITTLPQESGPNPNINTILTINTHLPQDPIYWPWLSCTVYDHCMWGLKQPTLGNFTIPLDEVLIPKEDKSLKEDYLRRKNQQVWGSYIQKGEFVQKALAAPIDKPIQSGEAPGVEKQEVVKLDGPLTVGDAQLGKFLVKPEYTKDTQTGKVIEHPPPDPDYYLEIGYDRTPGEGTKHYRYFVDRELENTSYIDKNPFHCYNVMRGQSRGGGNMLSSLFSGEEENTVKQVGKFKGIMKLTDKSLGDLKIPKPEYLDDPEYKKTQEAIAKSLLTRAEVLVRLYVLDCQNLMSMDDTGNSDPYLVIKLGKQVINDSENAQQDVASPKIFKVFDINTELPGASLLKVQVWDQDLVFKDEMIGQTVIDLEDRFFSPKWKNIPHKPIEVRPLKYKGSDLTMGTVRLWLEIFPRTVKTSKVTLWDITPRPPSPFETRVVVWGTEDIEAADIEGVSDLYIRAWIGDQEPQETDTHWRCATGEANFNWRMLFPLMITPQDPPQKFRMTIQIWDRDVLSFNDYLAEATVDFSPEAFEAYKQNCRIQKKGLNVVGQQGWLKRRLVPAKKDADKFWVMCQKRNDKRELVEGGKVMISLELVTGDSAKQCPVGLGRNEPNTDPKLPDPPGRISFSLNPFTMLMQMCGPTFKLKMLCFFCCIACCAFMVAFFPLVATNLFSDLINPFN